MRLYGSSTTVFHALRRLESDPDPWLLRRLAVRPDQRDRPQMLLSTCRLGRKYADFLSRAFEFGRVAVLVDRGLTRVLLALHDANITHELHRHVANVSLQITRGRRLQMVFDPVSKLLRGHSRVSMYATDNGGNDWEVTDLCHVMSDFYLHQDGDITVRFGDRVVRVSVRELLDELDPHFSVVNVYDSQPADLMAPLTDFTRPEIDHLSVFPSLRLSDSRIGPPLAPTGNAELELSA